MWKRKRQPDDAAMKGDLVVGRTQGRQDRRFYLLDFPSGTVREHCKTPAPEIHSGAPELADDVPTRRMLNAPTYSILDLNF
jgi:hypothetical protein